MRVLKGDFDALPAPIKGLAQTVEDHGEVHATVEEHDAEVEMRLGATTVDEKMGTVKVWDGAKFHRFAFDSIVSFYPPMNVYEGGGV